MESATKDVISMLVSSDKIMLFTITGEIIEIKNDEDYDTAKISEFLTPRLTGTSVVQINLNDYSRVVQILPTHLEKYGIEVIQIINGQEVQGIFYPRKVAVTVNVGKEKIVVPDIENLSKHIKRANLENSPSVANFLNRLAPVLQKRKHSGEDLMKFIRLSEMPLTNDGRIIAYKRVKSHMDKGFFVDCHTGLVKQRVGSRVMMKINLVDSDRHNSCSTGLHVANMGYLRGFDGTHTLIVLVNPEDFIAVPKGEDTKARVCSYDVIGLVNQSVHKKINTGQHASEDNELEHLIRQAVEGKHIQMIEEIQVGEKGYVLSITKLEDNLVSSYTDPEFTSSGKSLMEDKKLDEPLRDVLEATRAVQALTAVQTLPAEVIQVFDLLLSGISKSQVAEKFVISARSIGRWIEKWNFNAYKAASAPDVVNGEDTMNEALIPEQETPVNDYAFAKMIQASEVPKAPTKTEQMRKLYNNWILGGKKEPDLHTLRLFKSSSKKSYTSLGLTDLEIKCIEDEQ